MKTLFTAILISLSFNLLAAPLSQEKVDKVNAYITGFISDLGFDGLVTLNMSNIEVDDKTKLLTSMELEGGTPFLPSLQANGRIDVSGNEVIVDLAASGNMGELGLDYESALGFVTFGESIVEQANQTGEVDAKLELNPTEDGMSSVLTVKPTESGQVQQLNYVVVKASLTEAAIFNANLTASFQSQAEATQSLQLALSNIVNSLVNDELPEEADFEVIINMVTTLMAGVSGAMQ